MTNQPATHQPAAHQPGPPYGAPPARRRSAGGVVAAVVGGVVVLGGIVAAALALSGSGTLDAERVGAEISRIAREQVGVAPGAVRCPEDIAAEAGGTFTCTAEIDGQQVAFTVRQDDDQGNVTIASSGFVATSRIEELLNGRMGEQTGVEVVTECAGGSAVVVGGPGTTITCRVENATDPSDFTEVTATVTDDEGTVDFG